MKTVMVVDDELAIRELLCDSLSDEGYRVVPVENGRRALDLVKVEQPDVVLVDLMLPGLPGRELIKRIRETPAVASTPIIAMSAALDFNDPQVRFIGKPFDVDEVLAAVATTIGDQEPAATSAAADIASRSEKAPE